MSPVYPTGDAAAGCLAGIFRQYPSAWVRAVLHGLAPMRDPEHPQMDAWQVDFLNCMGPRILLNLHRQAGKSTTAGALALWTAIYYPGSLTLLLSPSLRQSSEIFRKVQEHREVMTGRPLSPKLRLLEDNRLSCQLENRSRIVSLPGTEGTVRGYSNASLIIIDEAARVKDNLVAAVTPMLMMSHGRLVMMSTPHGEQGIFWKAWTQGGETWKRFELPWYENPRVDPALVEEERRQFGDRWVEQEWECKFVPTSDEIFTWEMISGAFDNDIEPLRLGDLGW